jgi:hypothetical protein
MQQRFKGAAGMGARGKNKPAQRQGPTAKRKRKTGGGQTLERPSTPRANQRRNQTEWAKKRKMAERY